MRIAVSLTAQTFTGRPEDVHMSFEHPKNVPGCILDKVCYYGYKVLLFHEVSINLHKQRVSIVYWIS